jgi:dephospho-CoA kinase
VVVLLGMPGAGKSTAARRLASVLGAPVWSSGDVIRATARARGLADTAENDRRVAEEFARRPGTIGRRLAAEVARAPSGLVVIEGFRTPAELDAFRARVPGATVVAVEVGTDRRHTRMLARGRTGENTRAYLRDRDRVEVRRGVRAAMQSANRRIRPRGESVDALDRSLAHMLTTVSPELARQFRARREAP